MTTITINSMGFVKGSDMAVYLRSGAKQSTLRLLTLQVVNIQYLLEFVRLCLYMDWPTDSLYSQHCTCLLDNDDDDDYLFFKCGELCPD